MRDAIARRMLKARTLRFLGVFNPEAQLNGVSKIDLGCSPSEFGVRRDNPEIMKIAVVHATACRCRCTADS